MGLVVQVNLLVTTGRCTIMQPWLLQETTWPTHMSNMCTVNAACLSITVNVTHNGLLININKESITGFSYLERKTCRLVTTYPNNTYGLSGLDNWGLITGRGWEFFSSTVSRLAVRPTQPPIQ
jgi:hypothetical protein